MPNPVDFVGVAKFTELAGGMEVNNLQAAIRKALKEITLPDVSDVPTGSTGKTSDLPTLAPPTAGGLSLETLAQMLSNEVRTQATKDGIASIEAKGQERAEANQKKLEEIMERLWGNDEFVDDNTLTVNITRIRKKLEAAGVDDFITTKRGLGYLVGV